MTLKKWFLQNKSANNNDNTNTTTSTSTTTTITTIAKYMLSTTI